ncbi:MAG: hypothetical protein WD232_01300 [Acidimicrobiales bacterium]
MGHVIQGLAAGAAGTAVLNTVTYLDMAIRARPSSSVPADTVDKMTELAGVTLAADGHDSDAAETRRDAIGALLGYATGFAVGAAYGLLRPGPLQRLPMSVAGVGIAAVATASTVAPYSALGVSDPRTWPAKSWAADIIPHLCYGWTTAAVFDALHATGSARRARRRR